MIDIREHGGNFGGKKKTVHDAPMSAVLVRNIRQQPGILEAIAVSKKCILYASQKDMFFVERGTQKIIKQFKAHPGNINAYVVPSAGIVGLLLSNNQFALYTVYDGSANVLVKVNLNNLSWVEIPLSQNSRLSWVSPDESYGYIGTSQYILKVDASGENWRVFNPGGQFVNLMVGESNGFFYVLNSSYELVALNPSTGAVYAKTPPLDYPKLYSHAIIANGKFYFIDGGENVRLYQLNDVTAGVMARTYLKSINDVKFVKKYDKLGTKIVLSFNSNNTSNPWFSSLYDESLNLLETGIGAFTPDTFKMEITGENEILVGNIHQNNYASPGAAIIKTSGE